MNVSLNSNRQYFNTTKDQTRHDNSVFIRSITNKSSKKSACSTNFSFANASVLTGRWLEAPVGVSSVSLEVSHGCRSWKNIYLSVKALRMPLTREASSSFCATSGVQLSWKIYASLCFPRDMISTALQESRAQSRCLHTGYSNSRILPNTRLNHRIQV